MIKLEKLEIPNRLADNHIAWTKSLIDKLSIGETPTNAEKSRYRHPEIKAVLTQETNGKCAYCESRLQHIHHGDVEHIYPKSLDPTKTFEWENLTLSCEICNQNKSNKDPYLAHILDPYLVNPEEHLLFLGGLIFSKGTVEGTSTLHLLDLHRPALVEMRNDQVKKIMGIYTQVLDANLPISVRKAIYEDLITREAGPKAPYTAMAKCVIQDMSKLVEPQLALAT